MLITDRLRTDTMKDYKQLKIFQKARLFNRNLYLASKKFPPDERFGLTSQIRRASLSIAANIAEGCGRNNDREFARFLDIAYASACEVECLLLIAKDVEAMKQNDCPPLNDQLNEIKKMAFSFARKLRTED